MPPEPLSWDRRDFRKHDRSASDPRFAAGGGGPSRWPQNPTAPPPHPPPPFQQQQRWFSDFRSPRLQFPAEGQGKQGGWQVYSDDASQGFAPSGARYTDRNLGDENCRPFGPRNDGRYIKNNRENRNPFTRNVWKAPNWEPAKSPNAPAKPIADVSNLMSVNTFVPPNSVNLSEQSQSQPQPLMKEKNNKNGGPADETTCLESGKENCVESVDWKPLKLARVGSSSSRGSCFIRSSSSKSVGVPPTNIVSEVKPKNTAVVQSPADDARVRSISPGLSDETVSRRKRRLGWGEGLAKYEKKRVDVPEDGVHKNDLVISVSEKSPRVTSLSDCVSPATPSSFACSSSSAIEEKGLVKEADVEHDTTNLRCSPSIVPQIPYNAPTFNLQNLELASIANVSLMINDLLKTDDRTGCVRTTSMNKLLVWKVDMLRALEMTETEIESLETELKSLMAEPRSFCSAGSSSLPIEEQLKICEELVTASKCGIKLVPLQTNSSEEMIAENAPVGAEDVHALLEDEDIDSPGSATSRYVETAEVTEGSMNLNLENSRNLDDKCLKNDVKNSEHVENHVVNETTLEDLAGVSSVNSRVDNVYDSIVSSNRDAARKSMEQLNKLLPKHLHFKSSISVQSDPSVVEMKILRRKQFLRFKEKVLTIKFKALRHFWKEDRLVSTRKLGWKTQKKFDPSRIGHKRNHSSHARGPHTVPADEVVELVNGLLSKSAFEPHGSTLKMPAMILDKDVKMSRFISTNGLVEDPCSVEKERSMLNPWTSGEKEMFVDKLATFGKDFGKIASFLVGRSVADCIEFYYKNHKSKCFEKIRKNPASSNQTKSPSKTYLVATGKRRNPELNASSLDILGAASEIVANIDNGIKLPLVYSYGASSSREAGDRLLQGSDSNERETEAADALASICGSLSSEGVSSCLTSSVDKPSDGYQDNVGPRIKSPSKRPRPPDDSDNEMSDSSCGEMDHTDWTDEEKTTLIEAVSLHGKDFVMISQHVGTRSVGECQLFFSKSRKCLELDQIQPGGETPLADDSGGHSGIEDSCTVETGSVICNNESECSTKESLPEPDMKLNDQSDVVGPQNIRPDKDSSETTVVSSHIESEQGVKEEDDRSMPDGLYEAENKAIVEVSGPSFPEGNSIAKDIGSVVNKAKSEPQPLTLTKVSWPSTDENEAIVEVSGPSLPEGNSIAEDIGSVVNEAKFEPPSQPLTKVSGPSTNDCQQNLPEHSSSDSIVSSQILWGYPVSGQTMKERIGDKGKTPTDLPDVAEQNRNSTPDQFFLVKCNGLRQESKVVEGPFPSLGRSREHSRPCSSAGAEPSRNGDVKLFGTILNSSHQKTNNSVQRTDGNNRPGHKIEPLYLNLGAHQTANLDSVTYVRNQHTRAENLGFWDGNRIRTGIPPLPDSALLLAKYPAAFTNYTKLDQPPSVFPHIEASTSRAPAEYRYPELQPFTIGMNQKQNDVLHRRNSFDFGSGMPNIVARGGFVGGEGLGLTDPVAALKMQYDAKIEQLMKGGKLIKEVDRWISSRGGM